MSGHADVAAQQEHGAVVLTVAHATSHALLDPLHLAGEPGRGVGEGASRRSS
ncbi:hypothetical protein [Streptomyces sp. NPDC005283]|uniref:hypothetical protein n=1 Tax=Streptomyces sp. NPDC005283 TaxID=3156871 RepID=UPI003456BC46